MVKMKNSGIDWIGKIPEDWKLELFKNILWERSEKNYPIKSKERLSLSIDKGVTLYSEKTTNLDRFKENFDEYKLTYEGDLVMNSMNVISGAVGISKYFGCVSPAYYTYYDKDNEHYYARYCDYVFKCQTLRRLLFVLGKGIMAIDRGNGRVNTCRLKVAREDLGRLRIPYPKYDVIKSIVNCLDNKCSIIETLYKDIEKQIEVLEQYKKSVITEAVTKGINPDVKMKASGIEWIGEIPEHWKIEKGKYVLEYLEKPIKPTDEVITCFRDGEVTLRSNRREDGFTISEKEIGYQGIDVGDLVVHGMDGFAGSIGISDSRGKASPVLNVLDSKQSKRFLMYYLRSMAYGNVFLALATGIRVRSCDLRWNKLAELPYPIPPMKEQKKIVEYIDSTLNKTNKIINTKKQQLNTLEEYKKSLIFEYVTGKKEC